MKKSIIRLAYRKVITASAATVWERQVFNDTYREFFMQAQFFNQENRYQTFTDLLQNVPAANQLHYLVSTAAIGYIRQLNDVIPDVRNGFGEPCLPFHDFRFEVIQSHVENKDEHQIAITFFSDALTWIDTAANHLLVAYGDQTEALAAGKEVLTDLIPLQPFLNIYSIVSPKPPVPEIVYAHAN